MCFKSNMCNGQQQLVQQEHQCIKIESHTVVRIYITSYSICREELFLVLKHAFDVQIFKKFLVQILHHYCNVLLLFHNILRTSSSWFKKLKAILEDIVWYMTNSAAILDDINYMFVMTIILLLFNNQHFTNARCP